MVLWPLFQLKTFDEVIGQAGEPETNVPAVSLMGGGTLTMLYSVASAPPNVMP